MPNVSVTFAAPTSGASAILSNSTAATDANGQASVTATANTLAGSYTVTASAAGVSTPAIFVLTQTLPATGVSVIGSVLYIVGGSTSSDTASVKPAGTRNDGTTGLTVSATLNKVSSSKTFTQPFTAIVFAGYAGNETFTLASTLTLPTTVTAGNGNDAIVLGGGNNTVALGGGNDAVAAGGGNNSVTVGNGNDVILLGNGNDTVTAGNGSDAILLGNGNDTVTAGNGIDGIMLGGGNDAVALGGGNDAVAAGSGNDTVTAGNGNDVVLLGGGNDTIQLGGGNNTVTAGNGNDTIGLGDGSNVVVEGNGTDSVTAGNGNNLIVGGLGPHTIKVGNGTNILIDGTATVNKSGDSFRRILNAWTAKPFASKLVDADPLAVHGQLQHEVRQLPDGRQRHRLVLLPVPDDLEQEVHGLPELSGRRSRRPDPAPGPLAAPGRNRWSSHRPGREGTCCRSITKDGDTATPHSVQLVIG